MFTNMKTVSNAGKIGVNTMVFLSLLTAVHGARDRNSQPPQYHDIVPAGKSGASSDDDIDDTADFKPLIGFNFNTFADDEKVDPTEFDSDNSKKDFQNLAKACMGNSKHFKAEIRRIHQKYFGTEPLQEVTSDRDDDEKQDSGEILKQRERSFLHFKTKYQKLDDENSEELKQEIRKSVRACREIIGFAGFAGKQRTIGSAGTQRVKKYIDHTKVGTLGAKEENLLHRDMFVNIAEFAVSSKTALDKIKNTTEDQIVEEVARALRNDYEGFWDKVKKCCMDPCTMMCCWPCWFVGIGVAIPAAGCWYSFPRGWRAAFCDWVNRYTGCWN